MQYSAKSFSELIEDSKHTFVKRKFISTFLGGYRVAFNEEQDSGIGIGLHLGQLFIMLLSPLVILLIRMAMPEDQLVASVAAGAVLLVINLFLNAASYVMEESDETSCMSKGGFLFLFPKKQGLFHMAVCLVHTFLFGALVEHAFHP